ncbi:MAG: glycosyltransferase family 4 protein [Bacteroidales bacterium]|nr:glycosyltransferase family 4 protein [Bacteroidales bacterium]
MKIAFFLGALNRGGAETLLADVFSHGDELPFDAVCLYRNEGDMSDAFHRTSVPMLRLARKHSWLLYGLRLRKLLLSQKVDIVHAQSAFNATLAILFTAFTRIKVVVTMHGLSFASAHPLYKRFVFRHSRRIICVSESERAEYLRRGSYGVADRMVVVHNGINFSKFDYANPQGTNDGPLRLCMVGNFVPEKNQLLICQFLKMLASNGHPFDFYFIGRKVPAYASCYDRCVAYCEQNGLSGHVHFMGGRDDVPELLRTMDAFIYSSKSETFGIAVVEAMAVGLPTFVNDLDVFVDITQQGRLAMLYKSGDPQELYDKYIDFLRHREDYRAKALKNAPAIRDKHSITTHIANLHSIYTKIIFEK